MRAQRQALVASRLATPDPAPRAQTPQQAALLQLLHVVLSVALSPGAAGSYHTGVTHWFHFACFVWGDPTVIFNPSDWVLAVWAVWMGFMYVSPRTHKPIAGSSINTYAYGIANFYSDCGKPGLMKQAPRAKRAIAAIDKFSPNVKRVMPITIAMVRLMASMPIVSRSDEIFQLAVLLGFFFLLRVGELLETYAYPSITGAGAQGVRQLRFQDLRFFTASKSTLTIRSEADVHRAHFLSLNVHASKADQTWLGCMRLVEALPGAPAWCPVKRAAKFVLAAPPHRAGAPLFSFADNTPVSDSWFRDTLKAVLATLVIDGVRVDPKPFNTHSLRSGGATRLFELGMSPQFIAMLGRWSSDAVLAYIRVTDFELFRGVSSHMAGV